MDAQKSRSPESSGGTSGGERMSPPVRPAAAGAPGPEASGSPRLRSGQAGPAGPAEGVELADTIRQARAGDRHAWGELYRWSLPAVFRFCGRVLASREDAEDAPAEILLKVREKLGQYNTERPFSAWLYKVAANHCWDLLRRRRVRQDLVWCPVNKSHMSEASRRDRLTIAQRFIAGNAGIMQTQSRRDG
jgi:hypothetical protein